MEELKVLIGLLKDLPGAALWVVAAVFLYKTLIIGSIYGVIRFVVERIYLWAIKPKHERIIVEMAGAIKGMVITHSHDEFISQLNRLRGKRTGGSEYVHDRSVEWLREAIDAKEAEDRRNAAQKAQPRGDA